MLRGLMSMLYLDVLARSGLCNRRYRIKRPNGNSKKQELLKSDLSR